MSTETELVNAALRKVGGKRITDVSESVGTAGVASDILAFERDELLRSMNWNFAVTRAKLAQLTTAPVFEYAYAYSVPTGCMRVIGVYNNDAGDGDLQYKLESVQQGDGSFVQAVVTAANAAWIKYVRAVTDPNEMSSSFRSCLILRLAKVFAISLKSSNVLFQSVSQDFESMIRRARSVDGIEDFPDTRPQGTWAGSRRAYGWTRRNDVF